MVTRLGRLSFHHGGVPSSTDLSTRSLRLSPALQQSPDEHLAGLIDMPFHHKDPFDRMLIAQAGYEGIPIVSADAQLDAYGITRIW
jgi:PIN domain nuclease of toxin-antitoxin system